MIAEKKVTTSNIIEADIDYQIALGNIKGRMLRYKFGRSVAVTSSESIIWDGGNGYTFQDTAIQLDIASDNVNDTNGGSNAYKVRIYGLDAEFNEISEEIILNGTTTVTTTKSFIRVFSAKVTESGNGIFIPNIGDISIYITGSTDINDLQARILAGQGQTQMCIYTVPVGYTALIPEVTYSSGEGKNITMRLRTREFGGAFVIKAIREVFEQNVVIQVQPPLAYTEKTDIVLTGTATTGTQKAAASFNIILVKNND